MVDQNQFREVIKYDKKFTEMFSLGDLNSTQEAMVYSVFGELRDRYNEGEELIFSYTELAVLSGKTFKSNITNKVVGRTGKQFEKTVENLQERMTEVVYKHPEKIVNGKVVSYTAIPLFKSFHVNHEDKLIKIQISDAKYTDTELLKDENGKPVLDENGNQVLISVEKQVKDLFNNDEWGKKAQYIQFGRDFHNLLKKQYSKRLFRFLADYRSTGFAIITAEKFENERMILNTPSLLRAKNSKIQGAIEELNSFLLEDGTPVIKNLKMDKRTKGRKITHYVFTFEPFDDDLRNILSTQGNMITFADRQELDKKRQIAIIMQKFNEVFPKGSKFNNYHNSGQLKAFLEVMDYRLIVEALKRTGENSERTFGWTREVLTRWSDSGFKTLKDLKNSAKTKDFAKSSSGSSNIPIWSEHKDVNELTDEEIVDVLVAEVRRKGEYPSEDDIKEIIVKHLAKKFPKKTKNEVEDFVNAATLKFKENNLTLEQSLLLEHLKKMQQKPEYNEADIAREQAIIAEIKSWPYKHYLNLNTRKELEELEAYKKRFLERRNESSDE